MDRVVIYGVGSPLVVDVQESLTRADIVVAAAVRNLRCEDRLLDDVTPIELADLTPELLAFPFLAPFFTPANRQKVAREAFGVGFRSGFSLIDPSVPHSRSLVHGQGLYVNAGCTLGAASEFGEWVFINRGVSIGHHARFGDFVSVAPGAVVGGSVTLGSGSMIGVGAVVLPELRIGSNSVVGAGSVVTKDVPDNCLVFGVPARVERTAIAGYGDQSVLLGTSNNEFRSIVTAK
jgi:sugar O-acyltransferase (sialic acid O-acetyltransferase NeuD family)